MPPASARPPEFPISALGFPSNAAHRLLSNNFPPTRQTASPRAWLQSQIHGGGTAPLSVANNAASRLKMRTQTLLSPACEMETSQHVGAVAELDLSICQPNTLVDRINAVPGLKTSAGKFESFCIPFETSSRDLLCVPFSRLNCCTKYPQTPKGVRGIDATHPSHPALHRATAHRTKPLLTHPGQRFSHSSAPTSFSHTQQWPPMPRRPC